MKIRIKTGAQCDEYLRKMALEAGCTIEKLAEIAVYNLVACWMADCGESYNPHDVGVLSGQPGDGTIPELRAT